MEKKKAASVLYSSREAVRISRAQVREIAHNGFIELLQLEPRLQEFEDALFGKPTVQFDRGLLNADETAEVDERIAQFLRIISPFLDRRAAWKAVEHLIRCFEANIYNVDALMASALPFHQTEFFGRLVGTCHIADSRLWHFLDRAKRNKSALVRSTLVQQCVKEKQLVDFIATATQSALREGFAVARPCLSFAAVLFLEVLQRVDAGAFLWNCACNSNCLRAAIACWCFSDELLVYRLFLPFPPAPPRSNGFLPFA